MRPVTILFLGIVTKIYYTVPTNTTSSAVRGVEVFVAISLPRSSASVLSLSDRPCPLLTRLNSKYLHSVRNITSGCPFSCRGICYTVCCLSHVTFIHMRGNDVILKHTGYRPSMNVRYGLLYLVLLFLNINIVH